MARLAPSYFLSTAQRLLVSKFLANQPAQRAIHALGVIHAQPNPVVLPKIELSHIPVQVLFGAVLEDSLHLALEHGVEAFHSRPDVFVDYMIPLRHPGGTMR